MVAKKKQAVKTKKRPLKSGATKAVSNKENMSVKEAFDFTLDKIAHYIDTRAYYIWEAMGKPESKHREIWEKAEKEILSQLMK